MISIAIATYNGSKYIREQLDSILKQTYQDFELIICDDCSTDNTWQILEEYAHNDSRIKIFKNESNLGFKKNFEKAISLSNGEYIALSDQDDVWTDNHLEILMQNIGDKSISCGNSMFIDSIGNSMNVKLNENEGLYYFDFDKKFIYRSLLNSNCLQGANMLMPKIFLKNCLPIPQNVLYHDAWFTACACFENGIAYTFDVINNYRQHGNNITFSTHNQQHRNLIQKTISRCKTIKDGAATDRFGYVDCLREKYGLEDKDFAFIYHIFEKIKAHKFLSFKDIKHLWDNYFYIKTAKTHKGFLKFIIALHFKRPL